MNDFIEELLLEAEAKEQQLELQHVDILLAEIGKLEDQIQKNFEVVTAEKQILDEFVIRKNSKLQDRIDWMTQKLEKFMQEQGDAKTIDLANGKLLKRKQPTKVEITNMDEFLQNDNLYQLGTSQPETIKPNLNMIKAFINMTKKIPKGVKVIEGSEKFSIKLKKHGVEDNGTKET